jgi:hypothetical protein
MFHAAAQPAHAQPPSPIALEELLGSPVHATVECDPAGSSHVPFATSGTALGTYPGTFTEQGSVSFGPSSFEQPGAVTAFAATFTSRAPTRRRSKLPAARSPIAGRLSSPCSPAGTFRRRTSFQETLSSELTAVEPVAPTSKDDCKRGGWRNYLALGFKNQGDCVSFVATGGRNEPGKNRHGVS